MENRFPKTYNWLSLIFLLLSIFFYFSEVSIFDSEYLAFYAPSVVGLFISLLSGRMKLTIEGSMTRLVGKIGFYGNLAIVILFFLPIYHIWGTLIFGS